jgi:L-ascorbate metabolism protein UlaG (beta-lactamase superfamily)
VPEVTWLGHATVAIDAGGVRVLTDPLLRGWSAGLNRIHSPPHRDHWADPDAVLLSHLHHDHADVRSLRMVRSAPVMSGAANTRWAVRRGFRGRYLVPGEWTRIEGRHGEVEVRLVRADHHARPMPHRPNDAYGFLIRSPETVIWFAGDTSLHDEMADFADIAGREVDVALVPIGGWGPRLSPGHMGPDEAAEACRRVGARHAVPIHYGTLHPTFWPPFHRGWMWTPLHRFADVLPDVSPCTTLHGLAVGHSVVLP